MMESWLPWIVLLISAAAVPLLRTLSDKPADPDLKHGAHFSGAVSLGLSLVFVVLGFVLQDRQALVFPMALGIGTGLFLGGGLGFLGSRFDPLHQNRVAPTGFGIGLAYLAILAPIENRSYAALGVAAGLGVATWIVGGAPTPWPALASLGSLAAAFAIASQAGPDEGTTAGALVLGLALAFFFELVRTGTKKPLPGLVGHIVVGGLASLVVWKVGSAFRWPESAAEILAVGIAFGALACIVADLLENQPLVGALLGAGGIALGTTGYLWTGENGTVWMLVGFAMLPMLRGGKMAVGAMSGLTTLAFLYIVKWMAFDGKINFELGRHYMLTGLILGITVPMLLMEWQKGHDRSKGVRNVMATALMLGAFVAACYAIRAQVSEDTLFGIIVGLSLSGAVSLFGSLDTQRVTALGTTLASFILLLAIPKDPGMVELARDERIRMILIMTVIVFVCVVGAVALAGRRADQLPSEVQPQA